MAEDALGRLIKNLASLPGIGKRTAERLAYHLLAIEPGEAMKLAYAVRDAVRSVRRCPICFNIAESGTCRICDAASRDATRICVVETPRDLAAIETAGGYRGLYHVLQGTINPLENVHAEDITADALLARVEAGDIAEVILATNPTTEGDMTAAHLRQLLAGTGVAITRIARGVPTGSSLGYLATDTVGEAMRRRHTMEDAS